MAMASARVRASAKVVMEKLLLFSSPPLPQLPTPKFHLRGRNFNSLILSSSLSTSSSASTAHKRTKNKSDGNNREKERQIGNRKGSGRSELLWKRRTRSEKELDEESFLQEYGNVDAAHVPVLLGEVLDVFASIPLRSFVDCTLGAAGHSSAIIQAHPEMQLYIGLDVDPVAHQMAQSRIKGIKDSRGSSLDINMNVLMRNFKDIKSVLHELNEEQLASGVNGILMDLGMSSMQVNDAERGFSVLKDGPLDMRMNPQESLRAEDILNSWPAAEVGQVLREYGEENNWYSLQNKIVKTRLHGGLHSTSELVDLIRKSTSKTKGRQGWIKTATRVFQALRIAVNDELRILEDSIYACFDSLSPGGRLAVISFHSLEDRIVKQAFLKVISSTKCDGDMDGKEDSRLGYQRKTDMHKGENEAWIRQMIHGVNGSVLTKRPITPSEKEEFLNPRSRSAKLRVIQKL